MLGYNFDPASAPRGRRQARRAARRGRGTGRVRQRGSLPVRNLTKTVATKTSTQRLVDEDNMMQIYRVDNTIPKITYYNLMSPTIDEFFPRMAMIAHQYSKYDVRGMRFIFTPSAAATVNGTLYMAFLPRVDIEPGQYNTPEDFTAVPGYVSGSISSSLVMFVPLSQMCKRGSDLFTDNGGENASQEPSLYNFGYFVALVDSLDVGSGPTALGQLSIAYDVVLKDPILDCNAASASVSMLGGEEPVVEYHSYYPRLAPDDSLSVSRRRPVCVQLVHNSVDDVVLNLNGTEYGASNTLVGTTSTMKSYLFNKLHRRDVLSVAGGVCNLLLFDATSDVMENFWQVLDSSPSAVKLPTTTTTTTSKATLRRVAV